MNVPRGTRSDNALKGPKRVWAFAAVTYDTARIKAGLAAVPGLVPSGGVGKVLLKPNLLAPRSPESAVVTHPAVVEAVAELFLDAGWKVEVGDSAAYAPSSVTMSAAGYRGFMNRLGLDAADLGTPVAVEGRIFRKLALGKAAIEADLVVNLPKLKTHAQTGLTLGVKNLFGCVPGLEKARWHLATGQDAGRFSLLLLDVAEAVGPHFSVLDGITGMDGRGPSRGRARPVGAVFASDDVTALDLAVAEFVGSRASSVTTLRYAEEFYGGPLPEVSVEAAGEGGELPVPPEDFDLIAPESLSRPYLFPRRLWGFLRKMVTPYPVAAAGMCDLCETCVDVCPVKAVKVNEGNGLIEVDYDECIRCFCCEEACTKGAMGVRVPLAARLLGRRG